MGRRRFSCAFGLQSTTADVEIHALATNGFTIVDSPIAGFAKAARINGLVSGQSSGFDIRPGTLDFIGLRWYHRTATRPSAANTILRLSGAAVYVRLKENNDGSFELSDEDGVIGTSAAVGLNTDVILGVKFDRTTSAGTHQVRFYINDVEVVGSGTRDISGTPNSIDFGGNRTTESQTVGDWYITGIAVNDNSGSDEPDVPGPGYLAYAFPTANGDANVGAARGGADSGADWSQLEEVPPNDATDYMELNQTNSVVWCRVTDSATLGIGGAYLIKLVQVGARIALASAAGGNWLPSIKSQAGGAVLDGAPVSLGSASYFTHDDTTGAKQYKLASYTDPQTGGPWTPAKLDTMQIGAKTSDGNPALRVSALWAVIEYVPRTVVIPTVLFNGVAGGFDLMSGGLQ